MRRFVCDNQTMKPRKRKKQPETRAVTVGRALRRAAKTARKIARAYGTPIYVWRDGKVVAVKP